MSLNINGRMKVKTLKSDFKNEFGLTIRVYDGRSFADDNATLASIRKGDSTGGEFSPKRNTKVGNLEEKIMELFGLKTQIAGSDDSYLCDNNHTLSNALEVDENLMKKRSSKKGDVKEEKIKTEERETIETSELTDEEKEWLDDLWSLDEAPETIRASRVFMMAAVQEDGDTLEYASDTLKNDREIVTLAVQNSGSSLEFASDALKSDKEIVMLAIKENSSSLEYASDKIKNDFKFASEFIQVLNEQNKDPESYRTNVQGFEYLSSSVFSDAMVVEEMIKHTPHEFITALMNRDDSSKEIFETLKQFNAMISSGVKDEFEEDIKAVLILVNNDTPLADKRYLIESILSKYNMGNLIYGTDFELNFFPGGEYQETPLWVGLKKRIESEVMLPLSSQASSFLDYKGLLDMIIPHGGAYTLYEDIDRVKIKGYYEKLLEHLDEADADDLGAVYFTESGYLEISEELPDIANKIMNKLGEKLLEMDIESVVNTLPNLEYKCQYLPKNVKSKLLERLESLSDEEKEEFYVDEYIEYLSE